MTTQTPAGRSVRIVLAVAVGYGVAAAIVIAGSAVLLTVLGMPPDGRLTTGYLMGNIVISIIGAICAGYACSRLAPENRRLITVGLLGLFFLVAAIATWRAGSPDVHQQPQGYLPLVSLLGIIGLFAGTMIERAMHGTR